MEWGGRVVREMRGVNGGRGLRGGRGVKGGHGMMGVVFDRTNDFTEPPNRTEPDVFLPNRTGLNRTEADIYHKSLFCSKILHFLLPFWL